MVCWSRRLTWAGKAKSDWVRWDEVRSVYEDHAAVQRPVGWHENGAVLHTLIVGSLGTTKGVRAAHSPTAPHATATHSNQELPHAACSHQQQPTLRPQHSMSTDRTRRGASLDHSPSGAWLTRSSQWMCASIWQYVLASASRTSWYLPASSSTQLPPTCQAAGAVQVTA